MANLFCNSMSSQTWITDDGRTPLICCTNGDGAVGVAKLLLGAGCNVAAENKLGITALDLCVRAHGQDEPEWRMAKMSWRCSEQLEARLVSRNSSSRLDAT